MKDVFWASFSKREKIRWMLWKNKALSFSSHLPKPGENDGDDDYDYDLADFMSWVNTKCKKGKQEKSHAYKYIWCIVFVPSSPVMFHIWVADSISKIAEKKWKTTV